MYALKHSATGPKAFALDFDGLLTGPQDRRWKRAKCLAWHVKHSMALFAQGIAARADDAEVFDAIKRTQAARYVLFDF